MSDERPGSAEASWTVEALYQHFQALRDADHAALQAALTSAKDAVEKAERNADRWRDNANEWRAAMNDRERDFMRRSEVRAVVITFATVVGLLVPLALLFVATSG